MNNWLPAYIKQNEVSVLLKCPYFKAVWKDGFDSCLSKDITRISLELMSITNEELVRSQTSWDRDRGRNQGRDQGRVTRGTLSTELMEIEVISLSSYVKGILHTARISTVGVIV